MNAYPFIQFSDCNGVVDVLEADNNTIIKSNISDVLFGHFVSNLPKQQTKQNINNVFLDAINKYIK